MRNKHADMMHRVAEDMSLKVLFNNCGTWVHVLHPFWSECDEYKIEEPAKPHVHQALIDEAKANPSIEWQYLTEGENWLDCTSDPKWYENIQYRKKPRTVDMWQWAIKVHRGVVASNNFYPTLEAAQMEFNGKVVCKIEGSKITVETEA